MNCLKASKHYARGNLNLTLHLPRSHPKMRSFLAHWHGPRFSKKENCPVNLVVECRLSFRTYLINHYSESMGPGDRYYSTCKGSYRNTSYL